MSHWKTKTKNRIKYWIGKSVTKYPYFHPTYNLHENNIQRYSNHGYGNIYRGAMDLPKNDYPYAIEYEEILKPLWQR